MATKETARRREYHREYHEEHRDVLNKCATDWYYGNRAEVAAKTKERMSDPAYREKRNADARRTYRLRQIKKKRAAKALAKAKKNV